MSFRRPSACKTAWTTSQTHLRRRFANSFPEKRNLTTETYLEYCDFIIQGDFRILFVLDPWTLGPNTESFHCKLRREHDKNSKKRPARLGLLELQSILRFHDKTSTFFLACLRCLNLS
jgi:hypothetical protein